MSAPGEALVLAILIAGAPACGDGAPSYVEAHRADYQAVGYCPWGATVVAVRP